MEPELNTRRFNPFSSLFQCWSHDFHLRTLGFCVRGKDVRLTVVLQSDPGLRLLRLGKGLSMSK